MKLNEKYYRQCTTEPVDVQNMENGAIVEIHIMNDNPFYEKVINQGQFSIWAIDNSNVYKVFLEKGYYDIMKDLYSKKVDSYWVDYWNECDKARKNFFFKFIMPIIIVYYGVVFIIGTILANANKDNPESSASLIMLVLGVIGLFGIFSFGKRVLTKKIKKLNIEVLNHIKKVYGAKNFENLIRKQRAYCKDFFKIEEAPTEAVETTTVEDNNEVNQIEETTKQEEKE